MLLVKASPRPSIIHGTGLFADAPIRAGEVVSVWDDSPSGSDLSMNALVALRHRGEPIVDAILACGYVDRLGVFRHSSGPERFINHSDTPNVAGDPSRFRVAIRDIEEGEEIVEDYGQHEPGFRGLP